MVTESKENLCATCGFARDRWHDACYCDYYRFVIARGKKKCWGYEAGKENEHEEHSRSDRESVREEK